MRDIYVEQGIKINVAMLADEDPYMVMEGWDVRFTLVTYPEEGDFELAEAQINQQVNYGKVMTMLETMNESIITVLPNKTPELIGQFKNNIVILPDLSPMTICAALHAKLNTIISQDSAVKTIEIERNLDNVKYHYTLTENEEYYELPTTMEWLGDLSIWETPWWFRADPMTWDRTADSKEQLEESREGIKNVMAEYDGIFESIEESIRSLYDPEPEPVPPVSKSKSKAECEIIKVDFNKDPV